MLLLVWQHCSQEPTHTETQWICAPLCSHHTASAGLVFFHYFFISLICIYSLFCCFTRISLFVLELYGTWVNLQAFWRGQLVLFGASADRRSSLTAQKSDFHSSPWDFITSPHFIKKILYTLLFWTDDTLLFGLLETEARHRLMLTVRIKQK